MPRWTKHELGQKLQSGAVTVGESQGPIAQRPVCDEPLAPQPGEKGHSTRLHVRITSFRSRLIDPDNLCPKYFIDCLRYAGLIQNDTADDITLEISQKKAKHNRTLIELFR